MYLRVLAIAQIAHDAPFAVRQIQVGFQLALNQRRRPELMIAPVKGEQQENWTVNECTGKSG